MTSIWPAYSAYGYLDMYANMSIYVADTPDRRYKYITHALSIR